MEDRFEEIGEHMPASGQVHISVNTYQVFYKKYVRHRRAHNDTEFSIVSESIFHNVLNSTKWKKLLKVRKNPDVGVCATCNGFDKALINIGLWTGHNVKYLEIQRKRELHRRVWEGCRRRYNQRKLRGEQLKDWLSVTLDGAENKNTQLVIEGGMKEKNGLAPSETVSLKLEGVRFHGVGLFVYVINEWLPQGGNMAVSCLHRSLCALQDHIPKGKCIPRKLSITSDGGSENWNKTFFSYLCYLTKCGLFDDIRFQRLPVGHSHTDLDGLWGVVSRYLHGSNGGPGVPCYTPEEFVEAVKDALKGSKLLSLVHLVCFHGNAVVLHMVSSFIFSGG